MLLVQAALCPQTGLVRKLSADVAMDSLYPGNAVYCAEINFGRVGRLPAGGLDIFGCGSNFVLPETP